jgi:hypothetical protein
MKRNEKATFVFYSTPADCNIVTASAKVKMASFYAKLNERERYDFRLVPNIDIENRFSLFCVADPQVSSVNEIVRLNNETISDIKEFQLTLSTPCYGLILGDVTGDQPWLNEQVKGLFGSINMPFFAAIGNHDEMTTSFSENLKTSDDFSKTFGPVNYSFNRGQVHFICLDNVISNNSTSYSCGFTDEQIEWLKQDLSYVDKGKLIICYYHIPLSNSDNMVNKQKFLETFKGFAEVHFMCGHTHYNENALISTPILAYEHIHAAACGAWWKSIINGDGTPNGYAVYEINGSTLTNWFYKPTNKSKNFQMRLYNGDVLYGGRYGYYSFNKGKNTIVVNVWNYDEKWRIEAFEDGVKVADLKPLSNSKDYWAIGYHFGVLNHSTIDFSPSCKHIFLHNKINPDANLEIRATDRFGTTYMQNELVKDLSTGLYY